MRALLALLLLLPGAARAGDPVFAPRPLPVEHVYSGGWEHFVGGGVAVLDCDADGFPDLFAAGGAGPARLFRNVTGRPGAPLAFDAAPLPGGLTDVTGAYPLDIDGDGWLDLFVLRAGANMALRGGPGCRFEDAPAAWGLPAEARWSTAFSATWEPGEDRPTLAIGNYVDRTDPDGPFEACDDNMLSAFGGGLCRHRCPPATARSRCCSRTPCAAGGPICASPTTGTTMSAAAPNRCGGCPRPDLLDPRTAGPRCRSGAWASPARTSPATACPR
jgi:hypothetical protein